MIDRFADFCMALCLLLACAVGVYFSGWQGPEASGGVRLVIDGGRE
jgi:hypothetical protein